MLGVGVFLNWSRYSATSSTSSWPTMREPISSLYRASFIRISISVLSAYLRIGIHSALKRSRRLLKVRAGSLVSSASSASRAPSSAIIGASFAFASLASFIASNLSLLMLVVLPVTGLRYCQYFPFGYKFAGSSLFFSVLWRGGDIY
jgi:hypothetical protein